MTTSLPPIFTIPGLWSSGPQHWQTHWERTHPSWQRVQQRNYDRPDREEWIATLDEAVRRAPSPPVLAAHSLGCSLVTHWAAERGGHGVAGAFLVGPSDVESPNYPEEGRSFSAMSLQPLPFPSIVVASTNDVYVTLARAEQFARAWGSRLIVIGDAGHINADAGYGLWPEGDQMLIEFCGALSS
jgi:predicted alpha/beta hydrolase family esterase